MTERNDCIAAEQIPVVLAAPPDDPRRRHLESCPRCRSLAAAYRDFAATDPADLPAEDLARLDRWIADRTPPPRHRRVAWPVTAGLLAAAALLVLLVRPADHGPGPGHDRLRGRPLQQPTITGCRVVRPADGPARLVWERPAGVDSCAVILLGPDLAAVDTLGVGASDGVDLPPTAATAAYGQVVGYHRGDVVAVSPLVALE